MKIFITGDTHTEWVKRLGSKNFPEGKTLTENDYVIVCGDFGIWDESKETIYNLKWLETKPFKVLFVSGNHDNYNLLKKYPVELWNGGKVQFILPNLIHLMRGQVFTLDDKKFFTFGGAKSWDYKEILDASSPDFIRKKKRLSKNGDLYRIKDVSWWEDELPSENELQEGYNSLRANDNRVDYIITHCTYDSLQEQIDAGRNRYSKDILTEYLQTIKVNVDYQHWYFGHYHVNEEFDKATCLYEKITELF